MSTTPESNTPTPAPGAARTPASRRYIISADGQGTVIRTTPVPKPAPRMAAPLPVAAPTPVETAAEDRRHLVHMRRFLRTALDRTHR